MVVSEYQNYIPPQEIEGWFFGKEHIMQKKQIFPYYWELDIGNGRISNIENIIIGVSLLWGIMRLVDLFRIMYYIDQRDQWLFFWRNCENSDQKINFLL